VETLCGSGAEGVAIPVCLLSAGEDEGRFFLLRDLSENLAEGDGIETDVGFDVNSAVDTHGKSGAESFLNAGRTDGDGDNLRFDAALAETKSLLYAVLVHGVQDELAIFKSHGVIGDVHALFRVKDLANERQYTHGFTLSLLCSSGLIL
jgi:hypothetical protein